MQTYARLWQKLAEYFLQRETFQTKLIDNIETDVVLSMTFSRDGPSDHAVSGLSPAEIYGSNPAGGMDVCLLCCALSGRGLCDELIIRPEES